MALLEAIETQLYEIALTTTEVNLSGYGFNYQLFLDEQHKLQNNEVLLSDFSEFGLCGESWGYSNDTQYEIVTALNGDLYDEEYNFQLSNFPYLATPDELLKRIEHIDKTQGLNPISNNPQELELCYEFETNWSCKDNIEITEYDFEGEPIDFIGYCLPYYGPALYINFIKDNTPIFYTEHKIHKNIVYKTPLLIN
ncbi:hypothetical protein [Aliamphritea spongicola]|nr:hypothetical protein [Aliamphritea spongicola]